MLQSVIRKLSWLLGGRAEGRRLLADFQAGERRVCELMEVPRTTYRYQSSRDDSDGETHAQ
jgi:hypothetical protein